MKVKKPVLFFDFDDMLVVTRHVIRQFIAQFYGVILPEEHFLCGNSLSQTVNNLLPPERRVSKEQFYTDCARHYLISHELHQGVFPVPGAEEWVPKLAFEYDLWILTARQEVSLPVVTRLCQRFFGDCISGMHFVYSGDLQVIKSKKDFIAGFPGDKIAFFDDNPGEIRNVQPVIPSYLFDPHSHHKAEIGVWQKVRSWDEIGSILL